MKPPESRMRFRPKGEIQARQEPWLHFGFHSLREGGRDID
jgi:hypothetical protein